ncbi:MAG: hypothetical protein ACI310_05445 [Bacilli bacterium]
MEEYIIELKEILFRIESLNKEISDLNILLNEYEKEIEEIDNKINNSLFNIRDRIDYLSNERKTIKDIISSLEVNKKKLKVKIIATIVSIICFGTSFAIGNFNVVSIISLVTSITGISIAMLNIISNKKKEKELEKYNLDEVENNIEIENNNLNRKYSKLNNLFERKKKLKKEESMLNEAKLAKRKMIVHLEKEKENKYNDFISSLEEEVKLSNQELDGQLEISGVRKIKRR